MADSEATLSYVYVDKSYPRPPPLSLLEKQVDDGGLLGARFSNQANQNAGRFLGKTYTLDEVRLDDDESVASAEGRLFAGGPRFVIANLEAGDLLALADLPSARQSLIFNVRARDDALRNDDCRPNVFHVVPSDSMRADALAQYLVWKKWRRWMLVTGKQPKDREYATALKRAAKRFGAKLVSEREYALETGARRMETGHQQIQTQMPALTRGAGKHDVVVVADEEESFGLYLPYRTAEPRPVVGSYGLVATAWHRSFEQYGGMALQNGFEDFSGRAMNELDYLAWLSVKLLGEACLRSGCASFDAIEAFITNPELKLAGYKGRPMSFRSWNQQLRQPVLLASARSLVSVAPLPGFLHQHHDTDSLGYDAPDSSCRLSES